MPGFAAIVGQERALRILGTLVSRQAVPHALLFTGADGIGKATTARALAMVLNCDAPLAASGQRPWPDACGRCRNCRRIGADIHPDVVRLSPEGASFKIGQVRDLLATLALKPFEARCRLVILSDVQALTPAAANALLKVLEEPPRHTILVLTAPGASDLLPTLASRCQPIRFAPLSAARIAAMLARHQSLPDRDATLIAALAGGSLSRAIELARQGSVDHWHRRLNWLAAILPELEGQAPETLLAMAAEVARDGKRAGDSLELAKNWLRDQIVVRSRPDQVIYPDRRDPLGRLAEGTDTGRLTRQIQRLQQAQRALNANAAPRLTLEALFLDLGHAHDAPGGCD